MIQLKSESQKKFDEIVKKKDEQLNQRVEKVYSKKEKKIVDLNTMDPRQIKNFLNDIEDIGDDFKLAKQLKDN